MKSRYLNKKMVITINKLSIELSGGAYNSENNIRPGLSLSFIETIHTNALFGEKIYANIFEQAAAYMFYIIKNHVFVDGNKRTGLATAITFLSWNNIAFNPFQEDEVFSFVMELASSQKNSRIAIAEISHWLESMCDKK